MPLLKLQAGHALLPILTTLIFSAFKLILFPLLLHPLRWQSRKVEGSCFDLFGRCSFPPSALLILTNHLRLCKHVLPVENFPREQHDTSKAVIG